ncbi:hypothetical protein Tco_0840477 [Tanacetum coccineum]|uniref:Uncharacterized protein n=1 Tax=Tanacetum coccineum TaxID=301880 RepID=A0ABQ5AU62_9ASTR
MKNSQNVGSYTQQEKPIDELNHKLLSTPAEIEAMQNDHMLAVESISMLVSCYSDVGYLTDADDLKTEYIVAYGCLLKGNRLANESGITKGARHFHAKVHYLREVIEYCDIKFEKVHTDDNLADPL